MQSQIQSFERAFSMNMRRQRELYQIEEQLFEETIENLLDTVASQNERIRTAFEQVNRLDSEADIKLQMCFEEYFEGGKQNYVLTHQELPKIKRAYEKVHDIFMKILTSFRALFSSMLDLRKSVYENRPFRTSGSDMKVLVFKEGPIAALRQKVMAPTDWELIQKELEEL